MTHVGKWISLAVLCAAQAFAQQSNGANLAGRVTDAAGKPVAKATLLLFSGGRAPGGIPKFQPYRAITAGDGRYSFTGIEPGAYNLQVYRAGYARAIVGASDFNALSGSLRIAAGQKMADIDFTLARAGSISGKVVDANGDPVSEAQIRLWRPYRADDGSRRFAPANIVSGPVISDAVTDNDGKYTIENIAPGNYYISAGVGRISPVVSLFEIDGLGIDRNSYLRMSARPNERPEGYLTTWYPHAVDGDLASPIAVAAGRDVQIDISLQKTPVFQVKGRLIASAPAPPPEQIRLNLLSKEGLPVTTFGPLRNIAKDGSFELNGLPPGEYYLTASANSVSGNSPPLLRQKIVVGDNDIDGLALHLPPPAIVHGTVTVNGKPMDTGLTFNIYVRLTPAEFSQANSVAAAIGSDGSFTLPRSVPGAYRITVGPPLPNSYVKSVRINGIDIANSVFTLASGPATMQIALGLPAGSIHATILPDARGQTATGVIVIPVSVSAVIWPYGQYEMTGDAPYVSITNLPPGSYRLYAIAPIETMNFDPAILKQYESQSVEVTVSGSAPVSVTVPTIPAAGGGK